ncbi:hypothetical protein IF1G_05832 [Cordyceps javanica]|uniref:Uncharacterized protein n=1 Tax=Cordyceps javanica TaxID=43265 RepID=A0A545V2S2_9HYPO|nr:hypothetical protein IF1G_05832 [Cordyceps javanica]TQW06795.1 hypothetical protein IF2G_05179 [Cordyceps javanica]
MPRGTLSAAFSKLATCAISDAIQSTSLASFESVCDTLCTVLNSIEVVKRKSWNTILLLMATKRHKFSTTGRRPHNKCNHKNDINLKINDELWFCKVVGTKSLERQDSGRGELVPVVRRLLPCHV